MTVIRRWYFKGEAAKIIREAATYITVKDAEAATDSILRAMESFLSSGTGQSLVLNGIGAIHCVKTPARRGRNPKTGEPFIVPNKRRLVIKPSKGWDRESLGD